MHALAVSELFDRCDEVRFVIENRFIGANAPRKGSLFVCINIYLNFGSFFFDQFNQQQSYHACTRFNQRDFTGFNRIGRFA